MTDEDWAPLPADGACQRPGETADVQKRELAPPPPAPTPPPKPAAADPAAERALAALKARLAQLAPATSWIAEAAKREHRAERKQKAAGATQREHAPPSPAPPAPAPPPPKPAVPDPAAEHALAALKAKFAQSAPATSWIAKAQHREHREQRKQKAAGAPQLAATLVTGDDPFAVPVVQYDAGPDGRDEREESEWFHGLPEKERERLRDAWTNKRAHATVAAASWRRVGNRRFVASVATSVSTIFLGTGSLWHATLGAGIACGFWWRHAPPDRFLDPMRAILVFFVMQGTAMAAHGAMNPGLSIDSVMLVAIAAIVGFDGEIRRSGGFDAQ